MNQDEKWMKIAINEANVAKILNEIPVGAVIIQNDQLIAKAHNQPISLNDPTAHAEIQVLRKAGKIQNNYRLVGTTLYVTLEPCLMCLGAMIHARIDRIVFGAYDNKIGSCGIYKNSDSEKKINHKIIITSGILENDCSNLLKDFFKRKR